MLFGNRKFLKCQSFMWVHEVERVFRWTVSKNVSDFHARWMNEADLLYSVSVKFCNFYSCQFYLIFFNNKRQVGNCVQLIFRSFLWFLFNDVFWTNYMNVGHIKKKQGCQIHVKRLLILMFWNLQISFVKYLTLSLYFHEHDSKGDLVWLFNFFQSITATIMVKSDLWHIALKTNYFKIKFPLDIVLSSN